MAVIPDDSQLAGSVRDSIADARSLASGGAPVTQPQVAQAEKAPVAAPAPAGDGNASISGTVTINEALASRASANDTLFIYARAETGPRMPLAILQLKVSDLPASFSLNDDMAMTPTMKISSFPRVVVEARVSKSGQAVPTSGDLQGFSEPVNLGQNDISIVIDQQVP